jgi:hypothetical protein
MVHHALPFFVSQMLCWAAVRRACRTQAIFGRACQFLSPFRGWLVRPSGPNARLKRLLARP